MWVFPSPGLFARHLHPVLDRRTCLFIQWVVKKGKTIYNDSAGMVELGWRFGRNKSPKRLSNLQRVGSWHIFSIFQVKTMAGSQEVGNWLRILQGNALRKAEHNYLLKRNRLFEEKSRCKLWNICRLIGKHRAQRGSRVLKSSSKHPNMLWQSWLKEWLSLE